MDRKNKITMAVIIAITLIMVGMIVVGVITRGKTDKPVVTTPTETTETESPTPDVPIIVDDGKGDGEDHKSDEPGEAVVDIIAVNDENRRDPEPGVDGEVIVIPGVKGEGDGE